MGPSTVPFPVRNRYDRRALAEDYIPVVAFGMRGSRDPRESPPKRTVRLPPEPIPTLGELRRETCWLWLNCSRFECRHSAPAALAPLIIRWGPQATSDRLRRSARCSVCGGRGATLQHPSWIGAGYGFQSFPAG